MASWQEVSDDPNSPEAIAYRDNLLRACHQPLADDRIDYLAGVAKGKRVLDIGVVDHTTDTRGAKGDKWLHGQIAEASASCLGVDILEDAVEALRKDGFNVICHDVTQDRLDQTFEVVTAGEILEHLGDPQSLFVAAERQLEPGGRFVLSTPNPYYFNRVVKNLWGDNRDSVDHTALHWPAGVAEMCDRSGLQLVSYRGAKLTSVRTLKGRLFKLLFGFAQLLGVTDIAISDTLIYECVKPANG